MSFLKDFYEIVMRTSTQLKVRIAVVALLLLLSLTLMLCDDIRCVCKHPHKVTKGKLLLKQTKALNTMTKYACDIDGNCISVRIYLFRELLIRRTQEIVTFFRVLRGKKFLNMYDSTLLVIEIGEYFIR